MNNRIVFLGFYCPVAQKIVSAHVIFVENSIFGASHQSLNASSRRSGEASLAAGRDDKRPPQQQVLIV